MCLILFRSEADFRENSIHFYQDRKIIFQDDNINKLCRSIPNIISPQTNDAQLFTKATRGCEKFEMLFHKFSECHHVYNSASYLSDDDIDTLGIYIAYICTNLGTTISIGDYGGVF